MPPAAIDVLGIGNAIVDVLARVEETFLVDQGLIKGTMRLIEEAEADRLYRSLGPAIEMSGGSAANTIAGVASFGGRAGFLGKIRDDQLGAVFAHDIRAAGVRYTTRPAGSGPSTGRCLIAVTPDGERTMNTYLGASAELTPDDVHEDEVSAAAILYLEGYLFDPPAAKRAFEKAVGIARRSGRQVSLTLSDAFCVNRHRNDFLELIEAGVDVLFANEAEARALFQVEAIEELVRLAGERCRLAVITRSENGSMVVCGGESHAVPVYPVSKVVDATGAGDLYAAGFLVGLSRGLGPVQCARLGSLAAAEIIGHFGARPQQKLDALAAAQGLL